MPIAQTNSTPKEIRVLVIDDDQTLCEMYSERLKIEGFTVEVAYDGEEGLEKAVKFAPNIILLDLMLPKVSGFDMLEILKSSPKTKDIPVVILTALIQEESRQREMQAGAADYIIKSEIMPMQVIEKIKQVLRVPKPAPKITPNPAPPTSPPQVLPPKPSA